MLPGADQHLTIISGDVTNAASLQAAMVNCEQLVHLAAVVDIKPPTDEQHKQQMISTALNGTRMVLGEFLCSLKVPYLLLQQLAIMCDKYLHCAVQSESGPAWQACKAQPGSPNCANHRAWFD
jgi:hypothetical protein